MLLISHEEILINLAQVIPQNTAESEEKNQFQLNALPLFINWCIYMYNYCRLKLNPTNEMELKWQDTKYVFMFLPSKSILNMVIQVLENNKVSRSSRFNLQVKIGHYIRLTIYI